MRVDRALSNWRVVTSTVRSFYSCRREERRRSVEQVSGKWICACTSLFSSRFFPLFAKIFIWIANQVESWYFARERCADEVSFWNSCFDRSTCFFYFSFLPLACQKTHDEIKKRRRNRGLRSLKNYLHTCVGGLSPPSSIPWVPSGRRRGRGGGTNESRGEVWNSREKNTRPRKRKRLVGRMKSGGWNIRNNCDLR